ncbi:MAG: hypothetical protein MUC38_06300 [Cyclobacteriaceae bacterium]|jgi:hypothetical protein|nr:hypothetical protein [Cyclobacteriaceae bacterium]
MKTKLLVLVAILFWLSGCTSLTSVTNIGANNSFVLGNNPHGYFRATVKNVSGHPLKLYQKTLTDSVHSMVILKPNETLHVYADKNTALIVENNANRQAQVKLDIGGDTNLSMGYKN